MVNRVKSAIISTHTWTYPTKASPSSCSQKGSNKDNEKDVPARSTSSRGAGVLGRTYESRMTEMLTVILVGQRGGVWCDGCCCCCCCCCCWLLCRVGKDGSCLVGGSGIPGRAAAVRAFLVCLWEFCRG